GVMCSGIYCRCERRPNSERLCAVGHENSRKRSYTTTISSERFVAFFPLSRAWRSRQSVSSADLISMRRCILTWLHQTLIEALSPWQWRVQRDTTLSLCGLETYPYPHTGLCKRMAERIAFASECQARVRGSTRE